MPAIDYAAARRLAYILKILLGLGAIIKILIVIYGTVNNDSELPINPRKTTLDNFPQSLSSTLARRVLLYAEKIILYRY